MNKIRKALLIGGILESLCVVVIVLKAVGVLPISWTVAVFPLIVVYVSVGRYIYSQKRI